MDRNPFINTKKKVEVQGDTGTLPRNKLINLQLWLFQLHTHAFVGILFPQGYAMQQCHPYFASFIRQIFTLKDFIDKIYKNLGTKAFELHRAGRCFV